MTNTREPFDCTGSNFCVVWMCTLFKFSSRFRVMFRVAIACVQERIPELSHRDELRVGGPQDRLSRVPGELFPTIFACIIMGDRISLSWASRNTKLVVKDRDTDFTNNILTEILGLYRGGGGSGQMLSAAFRSLRGSTTSRARDEEMQPHSWCLGQRVRDCKEVEGR
ncbi:hypothetical protein B0H13DRAFT_1871281 [Mycena leptocephala]|nr:hypothetical protein B0H13DRAFT_1871281 [Mycena leptocephala]